MRVLNIHGVDDVRLDPTDPPRPGNSDVVIKVKACGVCGSDLSYVKVGGIHRKPGGVTPIGHEAAGEVVVVGSAVKGVSVGQRVVINPMMTPSYIGSGGPKARSPKSCSSATLASATACCPFPMIFRTRLPPSPNHSPSLLHGVNRAQAKAGDKVVVFGCGPIGLGMVVWLVDRGVTDVVALDLSDDRLERAKALGARAVINPSRDNVRARLLELHGSARVFSRESVGTDAYIDAAGAPSILSDVISMAKYQSRLVDHRGLHEARRDQSRDHAHDGDDHHHGRRLSQRDA